MGEVVYYRGTGGVIWPMELPLPKPIQQQVTKGELRRVNRDGTPYREPETSEPDRVTGGGQVSGDGVQTGGTAPAQSAPKADWVGHAVREYGLTVDEAEALTKADLIARYGDQE